MDEEPMGRADQTVEDNHTAEDTRPAEGNRAVEELGGEPACLLAMLCPSCDAVLEARRPAQCPRCGADLREQAADLRE